MNRTLFIIALIAATLTAELLPARISFRIGPRHDRGRYYYYHPHYRYPQRYYRRYPRYGRDYRYLHYCYPHGCYRYAYIANSYVRDLQRKKDHTILELDNGMVFRIRKTKMKLMGYLVEVYAREVPSGWSLGVQGDDFAVRFGDRSMERSDYRLVIDGYEFQARRLE